MIPDAVIQRVRDATDVVELISGYVRLRQRGQNHVGLCPFHTEKTPSFSVNRARQIYHCFGCGKGGDVFGFLMEHERMTFVEAVRLLAERAHIEIPESAGRRDESADRVVHANAVAQEYFQRALQHETEGHQARAYLEERQIPQAMIERFALGFAPARSRGLIRYAERYDLGVRDLEAAGLVVSRDGRTTDRFQVRLMFPIRNLSGKAIAFGGRDLSGRSRAKYVNSPETALYQKGRVLYGLFEARSDMIRSREALLCEGYTDVLRLHEHDFTHAVAISGTALTPDQAHLLSRYCETAKLLLDADGPGREAALRSAPVLCDAGLDVAVATLPAGTDPDTYLASKGSEALATVIADGCGYVEFLEQMAGLPFGQLSVGAQDRLIGQIAQTAARIRDPVRRDLVTHTAWTRFGISELVFRRRLADQPAPAGPTPDATPELTIDWRTELLGLLVQERESRAPLLAVIEPEDFEEPLQRRTVSFLLREENRDLDTSGLIRAAGDEDVAVFLGRRASIEQPAGRENVGDYVLKLQRRRLEHQSRDLVRRMRAAEQSGDQKGVKVLSLQHGEVRARMLDLGRRETGEMGTPPGLAETSDSKSA